MQKIDAAIPAKQELLMRLTDLHPGSANPSNKAPVVSAKLLRNEEVYLEGDKFDCKVIEVA